MYFLIEKIITTLFLTYSLLNLQHIHQKIIFLGQQLFPNSIFLLSSLSGYKLVVSSILGLFGGIINGKFKPGGPSDREDRRKSKKLRGPPGGGTNFPFERRTMEIQCLPLTSIIKAMGNPTIDYLSLDIEGAEFPVLQSVAFDEVDIKVISIEVNHLGQIFDGRRANLKTLMQQNGYEFYKSVEIDDIWVKKGFLSSINKEEL